MIFTSLLVTNGCPSAPANVQDFFNCGCLSLGICLKAFVEITVLAAPVSAVNININTITSSQLSEIEKTNAGPAYGRPYGGFALS
jgi:hypothetical protein